MRWPMGLPAFDDLAQRIGLTPDDLLCQVAAHPDLIRQIEHALTLQAQLRQPAETVTLLPPGTDRPAIATLRMADRLVQARTPERDQRLVDLAKGAGYQWVDGWWVLVPGPHDLPLVDRLVEMGHRLLHAGLGITVPRALADRVRRGDYTPLHPRWVRYVTRGQYQGWFAVTWNRQQGDYYQAAISITDAWYERPSIYVPPTSVDELLDFAERYDFRLSAAAQTAAEQAQTALWRLDDLTPLPDQPAPIVERPVLQAEETEIDDELRDEPL